MNKTWPEELLDASVDARARRLSSTDALDNHVSPGVDAFFTTLPASCIIDSIIFREVAHRAQSASGIA